MINFPIALHLYITHLIVSYVHCRLYKWLAFGTFFWMVICNLCIKTFWMTEIRSENSLPQLEFSNLTGYYQGWYQFDALSYPLIDNSHTTPEQWWILVGHVNNIPIMQLWGGIPRNTRSTSYVLSLTECEWELQNDALWETL